MASIPITGAPSSFRAPFTAAQILFNQGSSSAAAGARDALYVGPMLSGGTATANKTYTIRSESDAGLLFGVGSPLYRAIRMHLKANKLSRVRAIGYAASSGGSPVAAAGTITFTGSVTGTALISTTICGEKIDTVARIGNSLTDITDALVLAVNAKDYLPVTASNSVGVLTLTAKVAGASQGDGTESIIRYRCEVQPGKGLTVATSGAALGLGTGTAGVDGTTTETANLTAALATVDNVRHYYVGFTDWRPASQAVVATHISTKSEPMPGLRSVAVCGWSGAQATAQAAAIARNYERLQIVAQTNSEHDPAELAANMIAVRQKRESEDSAYNFDDYSGQDWHIKPAYDESDWIDPLDHNDMVTDGLTAILSSEGRSRIGMSITTRSKDSTGAVDDFRSSESHRVSVMDELVDTILVRHAQTYSNFKFKPDALLPNGNIDVNQRVPPRTLVPSQYKLPLKVGQEFEDLGLIQGMPNTRDSYVAVQDPSNSGRLEVGAEFRTIDLLHQTTFRVAESSPN